MRRPRSGFPPTALASRAKRARRSSSAAIAGGRIVATDPATVLEKGTMVIAGGAGVFDEIKALAGRAYGV